MTTEFATRIDVLRRQVRSGERLRGSVVIDQVYAHYQHERLDLRHPRGGGPMYLTRPLFEHYGDYLASIARTYLDDGGQREMARCMEHLSDAAELSAPWEFGDLIHSGHPQVHVGHELVYDRPPKRHRLTEAELRRKARWRWDLLPDRLKGWIYWHNTVRGRMGLPPPRRRSP
jgi:hypothetical protein